MLAQKLPPYPLLDVPSGTSILHAFAMCYAAAYNPTTISARTWLALQRGFSIDQRGGVNRVAGGRPAFTWSLTDYGRWKHLLIAVEGTTSPQQHVVALDRLNNAVQVDADGGFTNENFKDYAEDIFTIITTAPFQLPNITDASTRVTFAGYSLGAAVADLLANKFAKTYPTRTVRLIKFASPKVGDQRYYDRRPARIQGVSVHHKDDLMWTLPSEGVERAPAGGVNVPVNFRRFVVDPTAWCLDWRGEDAGGLPADNVQARIRFVARAALYLAVPGYAFEHVAFSYRLMLNQYAARFPGPMVWAFNYLEFNDENAWQRLWRPGPNVLSDWVTIDDPPPADYDSSAITEYIRVNTEQPRMVAPVVVRPRLEDLPAGFHVVPANVGPQRRRERTNPIGS